MDKNMGKISFSRRARFLSNFTKKSLRFNKYPLTLLHAVTEACNAKCPYCTFRHGKRAPGELTLAQIDSLYSQASNLGMSYLHLWGGEPSIHPKISSIVRSAKHYRFITGMVSNGHKIEKLVREDNLARFIDYFYFSVEHPTKHDEIRETPGLYDSIIKGVEAIREVSPDHFILFNMVVGKQNYEAIDEMVRHCKELDVLLYVTPMRATIKASGEEIRETDKNAKVFDVDNKDTGLMLSWDEQKEFWAKMIDYKKQGFKINNTFRYMNHFLTETGGPPPYTCHWNKFALNVDANGDVVDCQMYDRPISNVKKATLKEILDGDRFEYLRGPEGEACNACTTPNKIEQSDLFGLYLPTLWELGTRHLF